MTETSLRELTPHLVVEMRGPNVVVRSSAQVDEAYVCALADLINAAAVSDIAVIIDPVPVRCDDAFAASAAPSQSTRCADHRDCQPVDAVALDSSMLRIPSRRSSWIIDLEHGRFCETAAAEIRHHGPDGWIPLTAIMVTATRLTALTTNGAMISADRAHRVSAPLP